MPLLDDQAGHLGQQVPLRDEPFQGRIEFRESLAVPLIPAGPPEDVAIGGYRRHAGEEQAGFGGGNVGGLRHVSTLVRRKAVEKLLNRTMSATVLALAALLAVQGVPPPPDQQPGAGDCAPRLIVLRYLVQRLGISDEAPATVEREIENGMLREDVTTSRAWVRIVTHPDGITCIVAIGERT